MNMQPAQKPDQSHSGCFLWFYTCIQGLNSSSHKIMIVCWCEWRVNAFFPTRDSCWVFLAEPAGSAATLKQQSQGCIYTLIGLSCADVCSWANKQINIDRLRLTVILIFMHITIHHVWHTATVNRFKMGETSLKNDRFAECFKIPKATVCQLCFALQHRDGKTHIHRVKAHSTGIIPSRPEIHFIENGWINCNAWKWTVEKKWIPRFTVRENCWNLWMFINTAIFSSHVNYFGILLMAGALFPFLYLFVKKGMKMYGTPNTIGLEGSGGQTGFAEPGPFHRCSCPLLRLSFWCLILSATSALLSVSFSPVWVSHSLLNRWQVNLYLNHRMNSQKWRKWNCHPSTTKWRF